MRGQGSQKQQQGFDLVFSDEDSGFEYKGDDSQIPSGSSVIVKRVPGGTVPSAVLPIEAVKHVGMKETHNLNLAKEPKDEFEVLGADFCPTLDSKNPDLDQQFDKKNIKGNKDEVAGLRLECKKSDFCGPNNTMAEGSKHGNDVAILPRADEHSKLNKLPPSDFLVVQGSNLPLELKCSLCNNFFKDAVMIPCCQHSFCAKCIRQVLIGKGMCPKCFSRQCSVADLLPNLSLRQAIEHFLESEMLDAEIENNMQKFVPDGESGIQAKDVSCALTVVQRELELPQSSCATGKGSNQVFMEAFHERQRPRNLPYWNSGNADLKSGLHSQKVNQLDNSRGMHPRRLDIMLREPEDFAESADFQGENQPVLPQAHVHDEADSSTKRKGGFWIDSGGGGRNFSGLGGHKKFVRNCYTCGSPDHLMRECPISHPKTMFQPGNGAFHGGMSGYAPPYWNVSSMPPFTPYPNMYSNPTMIPFNASMVPVSPFGVPPYMSSMHGSVPSPGANIRVGNMGPPLAEGFGLQQCGNKRKHSNENLGRDQLSDNEDGSLECHIHNSPEKSHDYKLQKGKEANLSCSDDSLARKMVRKCHHDKHLHSDIRYADERYEKSYRSSLSGSDKGLHHWERSNPAKENTCRNSDRHFEGRHKHHHEEPKKYDERRGYNDSDSCLGHRSAQKDVKRKTEYDAQGSHKKHHDLSESGFESSTPAERKGGHREKNAGHGSSRHPEKNLREKQKQRDDRYEDRRDDSHLRKRRAR